MPYDVGRLKLFFVSTHLFTSLDGEQLSVVLLRSHHCWSAKVSSNGEIVVALFGILDSGNACPCL